MTECSTFEFANKEHLHEVIETTINQIAVYVMDYSQNLMKKSKSYDIIESDVSALQKELSRIPMLKMQKYDLYKQGKLTIEQYQSFIEEINLPKERLENKLNQLHEEQESMEETFKKAENTQMIANNMLLRNGYDFEIISKFVKYIDVYNESEIEIVFDVDDVFFNKMINELE